jgi:hypothetical protein
VARAQLEELDLNGVYWQTPETFEDVEAPFEAVCAHELEGIVAKRRSGRYRPGARGWVKTKTARTGARPHAFNGAREVNEREPGGGIRPLRVAEASRVGGSRRLRAELGSHDHAAPLLD